MGICFSKKSTTARRIHSKRVTNHSTTSISRNSVNRWSRVRSSSVKSENLNDVTVHEQAIAAALLFQQRNGDVPAFDRSISLRCPGANSQCQQIIRRSCSNRRRSLIDPVIPPQVQQLIVQEVNHDELETSHIVLVHGGGFGAWCWYKTIALLQECKFKVTAIDLMGSGIDLFDANAIKSLSQYVKPLTDFMKNLADGEKVILVGHDIGGTCISYAMELFPTKVAKAIFVAASMLKTGQSTLDMFSLKEDTNGLMRQAQKFLYANGNNQPPTAIDIDKSLLKDLLFNQSPAKPPTAIDIDKSLLKDLLFNQSPAKDVALASVSMRPIPFSPVLEKLSLSDSNYGCIRRFYIETPEDNAIPMTLQQIMINQSPPDKVFRLKGSDHCPFFSKPQTLHKLLVEIVKMK